MDATSKEKAMGAIRKGVEAAKACHTATNGKGLPWWERALWILLAGAAAATSFWLTACTAIYSQAADGSFDAAIIITPQVK